MKLLRIDGWFLSVVGVTQVAFELLSHFLGAGPLGDRFDGSPFTIGFVEAHGLAAVIGVVLLLSANDPDRRRWHVVASGVHLLLGSANVLFWDSFRTFDLAAPGVVATVIHAGFVMAQTVALGALVRQTAGTTT